MILGKAGESLQRLNANKIIDGWLIMSESRPDIDYICVDNGNGTGAWVVYTATAEELAAEAQAYLDSTDWIEAKYIREVIRNESMTEDEYSTKYAEVIALREAAIKTLGGADE